MTDPSEEPLRFKFHWLDDDGRETSISRKSGQFDGEILTLEDVQVSASAIVRVELRDLRMAAAVVTDTGEPAHLTVQLSSKRSGEELKSALDVVRSKDWARHHREGLVSHGRGQEYRDATCPHCRATLVLSRMPETPQLFCQFCQRLTTVSPESERPKGEEHLRLCDECGMYSRPQRFTIGYVVFLLVFVYSNFRQTWRCSACMRGDAWRMLFGNLPTLLGTPLALKELYRSYVTDV